MPWKPPEPEILISISDCELIETVKAYNGAKTVHIINIGEQPLSYDVLAWINLLRRDDGGIPA